MSHDVIENKGRKKLIRRKSHDFDENKGVRYFATIFLKAKALISSGTRKNKRSACLPQSF
jgi:hypothetical protein